MPPPQNRSGLFRLFSYKHKMSLFMHTHFILLAHETCSDGQLIPIPYMFCSRKSSWDLMEQEKKKQYIDPTVHCEMIFITLSKKKK